MTNYEWKFEIDTQNFIRLLRIKINTMRSSADLAMVLLMVI